MCNAMDKHEPQRTFQAANPAVEKCPVTEAERSASELLEDSGNWRQIIDRDIVIPHLLSDSLVSEQQKLRHVLDWAHSFLSSDSEVHHELCRADSSVLAGDEQKKSPACERSSAAKCHQLLSCGAGGNQLFGGRGGRSMEKSITNHLCAHNPPLPYDPCIPLSFTSSRDEAMWPQSKETPEIMKNIKPTDATNKQTPSQDNNNNCSKVKVEETPGTKKEGVAMAEREVNEPQKAQKLMEKASCHLKISSSLSIYEQYQLCVDQLHHLKLRQSQHIEPGSFIESKERKTCEKMAASVEALSPPAPSYKLDSSTTNSGIEKHPKKVGSKKITTAESAKETSSDGINKNHYRSACITEHGQAKHKDSLTVKETPAAVHAESRPVCQRNTGTSDTCVKSGEFPKRIGHRSDVKRYWGGVKGQKKNAGGRGPSLRLCEKSRVSLHSPTNKEMLQRPPSSGELKHTPEDKIKSTSAYRDTHKSLQPTETHTPPYDVPGPTAPGAYGCEQTDNKHSPAGVPTCDRWLCLPDEVWLSILSLLPHSDLCSMVQVCSRLHALAGDHTLWKNLRIENATLTEFCLLCVAGRRPRSLCLYSCSLSLPSFGLKMFFTLCGNFLEELKVTSCTGPGLHGDQMLPLIGQLCDHVTSVDVSWSGATDKGVRALSDCSTGLRLKSVVLNGCHVTDDPLMKLVMRHKESLCRLEVFGCQFLTPSCLQAVYEMCPGLQHLNIGQVPKVDAHSLTVMASQLKCLISLNLTGLQAVTDASVDTLLQNCVKLQSLSFSSCLGVTDLTLHHISKHTPFIRSLDVSYCSTVTDAGVQSLALGCRRLQQLDLSSTGTGNRGVTLLANYCSRHLHTVKLSFCIISPESILKLCKHCERLKVLHLYGSAHVPTEREIRRVNAAVKVYPQPSFTEKHLLTTGQTHTTCQRAKES
ncbi:hypothetical protein L3Q82_023253 [Scortum barcoo]|uniref:Uncharacterized protein n=1 Tax=Scortum barcoo TaxID=214431 RepID=A0ACB8WYE0_9TELE|nr:hypothetical protein L3Q82_023253 [Scortum barcoo]